MACMISLSAKSAAGGTWLSSPSFPRNRPCALALSTEKTPQRSSIERPGIPIRRHRSLRPDAGSMALTATQESVCPAEISRMLRGMVSTRRSRFCRPASTLPRIRRYYALNGGKRVSNTQICWTNPDVARIIIEEVRKTLKAHPAANIISISQNDGEGPCGCDRCKAVVKREGSEIGPILQVVEPGGRCCGKGVPRSHGRHPWGGLRFLFAI